MSKTNVFKKLWSKDEAEIKATSGPVLKVLVGEKHIANLFHDDSHFCLVYRPEFLEVGLHPFNPEDLPSGAAPEINKCYTRTELWFVFAERLRALDREDFLIELEKLGLTKSSDPLVLLGKIGSISISKPWKLELVEKKAL